MSYVESVSIQTYEALLKKAGLALPSHHIVLGSGFGAALSAMETHGWKEMLRIPFPQIPGLLAATVPDHAGQYILLKHAASGKLVQAQAGRLHGYEGHQPQKVVLPVIIPRLAGVKNFILTNAAGGLDMKMTSGDAMLIADQVNLTGHNPLQGENPRDHLGKELGPRFPDMGHLYEAKWRDALTAELQAHGVKTHEGIYLGLMGPSFETFAEVKLYASWGMKAVGMSTVWEAIALRHAGARIAGVSLISNLGAGLSPNPLKHEEIVETCRHSAASILESILGAIAAGKIE